MAACKLKKGDRIYECKYHRSILTELLTDPVAEIQHDDVAVPCSKHSQSKYPYLSI